MAGPAVRSAVPAATGEVIRGERGRDGVRDVLLNPGRHGASPLSVAALVEPDGLQLLRAKYKPGRKLRAYYRRPPATPGSVGQHWAVTWSLSTPTATEPTIECFAFPEDPAMPHLERLTNVEHVAALARRLATGLRPTPSVSGPVTPVRYRPGQRHVLVAGFDARSVYLKMDRDHSGALAVPAAEAAQDALRSHSPDVRAATPLGFSDVESVALWCGARGELLSRLVATGAALGPVTLRRVSAALRIMHDRISPGSAGGSLTPRVHEATVEAAAVLRAGEHIAVLLPGIWPLYGALVAEVVSRLQELPAGNLCFAHGDFKSENILVQPEGACILDFDRVCWAEPALDLGKLLADLAWWCPPDPAYLRTLRSAVRAGYGPCDPAVWPRAALWSVLFRLKFAGRRCALHEADWPSRVREQVEGALRVLDTVRSRQ